MRAKNHILQSIIVCGKLELQNKTEDKKMAYSIDVAAARALATKAHEGQTDKAGLPYITHPERVALRMESLQDIEGAFGPETAAAVDAISRRDGEKWSDYLDRVAANPMARRVKISDLIDNSNLSRIPHVTLKDVERQKKYNKALKKLLEKE